MIIKNEYGKNKILFHLDKLVDFQDEENISPIVIECNITNKCNISCLWCSELCYRESRIKDEVEKDSMIKAIKEMGELRVKSIVFEGGGEPTLHKNLIDFVSTAYEAGIDVGLITNGTNLEEVINHLEFFKFVRVSLDAGNRMVFKKVKGIDKYPIVLTNLRKLSLMKFKKKLNVVLGSSFVVTNNNITSAESYVVECKSRGIDYVQFKPEIRENTFNFIEGSDVFLKDIQYKYQDDTFGVFLSRFNGEACVSNKTYPFCYVHRFIGAITANGNVQACCNLKHKFGDSYNFGNIHKQGFKDIWNSEKREYLLNEMETDKKFIDNCGQCRMDEMNKFLNFLKTKDDNNLKNFI